MLTVMHMKANSNRVYEALSVEHFPWDRVIHKGTEAERTQRASVFIRSPDTMDKSGIHLYGGTVYVMNSSGKTVATFEVQSGSREDGGKGDALLVIEEPKKTPFRNRDAPMNALDR